jgi:hypothetical protein
MEKRDLKWEMEEFRRKVGRIAPTLLLVEMLNGTECGGAAGVPWPPTRDSEAKDPSMVSCIFSLGATPTRFGLVSADNRAICSRWGRAFGFGGRSGEADLAVGDDGRIACGQNCYAGPQGVGTLIGASPSNYGTYVRWELWRL